MKVALHLVYSNSFLQFFFLIFTYHPTDELDINGPISCVIQNITKNQNLYPQFAMKYPVRENFLYSKGAEMGPRYVRIE